MVRFSIFIDLFGETLLSNRFQEFLKLNFNDLTEYNILESDYIISNEKGVELGFTNNTAVFDDDEQIFFESGNAIFSHFNIYPNSGAFITELPLPITFNDMRDTILEKMGNPIETRQGYIDILNQKFLVDNYRAGNIIYSIDYNPDLNTINFIQARDSKVSKIGP